MKISAEDLDEKNWKLATKDAMLEALAEHVDESLWNKAKKASQDAFGELRYPFVMYLYQKWGGK